MKNFCPFSWSSVISFCSVDLGQEQQRPEHSTPFQVVLEFSLNVCIDVFDGSILEDRFGVVDKCYATILCIKAPLAPSHSQLNHPTHISQISSTTVYEP